MKWLDDWHKDEAAHERRVMIMIGVACLVGAFLLWVLYA